MLVVPGLFPDLPETLVPALGALEWIWSYGNVHRFSAPLGLGEWPPEAPRQSLARARAVESGLLGAASTWFCADPIHLHIERDRLMLLDPYTFPLGKQESQEFCAQLNAHFEEAGMFFFASTPSQWVVGLNARPRLETIPLQRCVGRSIENHLPQGEDRQVWLALFNEVQMVLHDCALNQAREVRGERSVSGVWFWDEEVAQSSHEQFHGLRWPSAYGDGEAWRHQAQVFETTLVQPWLDRLFAGEISALTLVALEGRYSGQVTVRKGHQRRFWRRTRSLMKIPGLQPLRES